MLGAAPGRRLRYRAPARYVPLDPSDRHVHEGRTAPVRSTKVRVAPSTAGWYIWSVPNEGRGPWKDGLMYELITVALTIGAFTVGYAAPAVLGDILNRRSERAAD